MMATPLLRGAGVVAFLCAIVPDSARAQHTTGEPADSVRRELAELRSQVDSLRSLLERLRVGGDRGVTVSPEDDPVARLRAAAVAASAASAPEEQEAPRFEGRQRALQALNPELSVGGDLLSLWQEDNPAGENFLLREVEFALQATLDPFSRAKIIASHHAHGGAMPPFADPAVDMNSSHALLVVAALLLTARVDALDGQRRQHHLRGRHDPGTVSVVTTQPVYAALVGEVGGGHVVVTSIAAPAEDPHFVRPKPSFAVDIRHADLFVTTGLDLELWVPVLLDKAGNSNVMEGGRGYVTAHTGVRLLEVPTSVDRSAGDVHVFGNPHLHTDPLRSIQIARNITTGLRTVAPELASDFDANLAAFSDRVHRSLFGDALVDLLVGDPLADLALANRLLPFLQEQTYEGRPLMELLGGWMEAAGAFRGRDMICYHKNWVYFEERFGVRCAEYVEPKPGIPPTPSHVVKLVDLMNNRGIDVLIAATYFDRRKVESVASRGNAEAVILPLNPGVAGVDDYFGLVDLWVHSLAAAFDRANVVVAAGSAP